MMCINWLIITQKSSVLYWERTYLKWMNEWMGGSCITICHAHDSGRSLLLWLLVLCNLNYMLFVMEIEYTPMQFFCVTNSNKRCLNCQMFLYIWFCNFAETYMSLVSSPAKWQSNANKFINYLLIRVKWFLCFFVSHIKQSCEHSFIHVFVFTNINRWSGNNVFK